MAYDAPGGTGANLTKQAWADTVEPAVYDKARFLKKTKEYERGYVQLNVRKISAGTGQTIASTADGTGMTFDSMVPAVVTLTPAWLFIGHQYPDSLPWTSGDGIDAVAADDVERALAAYLENQQLADVQTLTNYLGNAAYDTDAPGFRAAMAQLATTAKVEAQPGVSQIYGMLGTLQIDDAMSVPEITHAEQRGDGQNPLVSGLISKGFGAMIDFTTLLASDANGLHGVFWVREAFGYYFNKRISGEKQRYLKQTRVMADAHFAHAVIHNARAVGFRTKAT
jgi:hypothetical protein